MFEPFMQGDIADGHSPGTGIGLALVARFVGEHHGRVWVTDRPGGGAVFHIRLPQEPASPRLSGLPDAAQTEWTGAAAGSP